jgi:hypothetical protein
MTFSRTSILSCFVVLVGGSITACGTLIGIGDPSLDSETEGGIMTAEAGMSRDTSMPMTTRDAAVTDTTPVGKDKDAGQIPCGAMSCPLPSSTCCVYHVTFSGYKEQCAATCPPPDVTEDELFTLHCSDFADCPGARCCMTFDFNGGGSSQCKTTCSSGDYLLCDPPPAANTCPNGYDPCRAFSQGFPSAFGYCRPG